MIKGEFSTRRVWIGQYNTVQPWRELFPEESQKLRNHSSDGFNWGYGGSGPAQLALAIMFVHFGWDTKSALRYYQDFKWSFVTKWNGDFEVKVDIQQWLEGICDKVMDKAE